MPPADDLIGPLNGAWEKRWLDVPPIGSHLRGGDHWVRFHTPPGSKQYPDTPAERDTILGRHNALLSDLGATESCFVILPAENMRFLPGAKFWRVVESVQDYYEEPPRVSVARLAFPSRSLDDVLLAVSDEVFFDVVIGPLDLEWLYSPYDGGADIIAPSPDRRDELAEKFAAWLPAPPADPAYPFRIS